MAAEVMGLVALVGLCLLAAGWVAHRIGLPPALGYLAVGMAFAPSIATTPDLPIHLLEPAAELAVLPLLFFIGLELDLRTLRQILSETAVVSALNILIPTAAVLALASFWGWGAAEALVLGLAVSMSSTIFGERLSSSPGFPHAVRRRVLGILIAEDVAAGAVLALLAVLGSAGDGWDDFVAPVARLLFFLVLAAAAALLVVPRLLDAVARTHVEELVVLAGGLAIVGFGVVGTLVGSAELGAFVAGMAAAEAGSRFTLRNRLSTIKHVALAVFLLVAGLHVDARGLWDHLGPVATIAALFLAAKTVVHVPSALAGGLGFEGALRTVFGLGTIGEFSLILAAAAARSDVAHPLMETYVVGVTLILLVAAPALLQAVPWMSRGVARLPPGVRKPLAWLAHSLRRTRRERPEDPSKRRRAVRVLLSNALLLAAWAAAASYGVPRFSASVPGGPIVGPSLAFGLAIAVAIPLLVSTYRAYRHLVRLLVGLEAGEREGAARVRARFVDAWVAGTAFLLLLPVTLILPTTLPVLLAGLLLAVIISTLAWRQLTRFQSALEGTVTRVLGQDAQAGALLDRVLEKYPWGVRFSAVAVAPGSPAAGRTLKDARIAELTGATVAVVQRRAREVVNPGPEHVLLPGDTVVLMGDPHQIARAEALMVSHGEALRLTVQSRLAGIVEARVDPASPLVGKTLGQADLRSQTGSLVVGVWPAGTPHPTPYRSDLVLQAGDQVILLGAPLQVERARLLLAAPQPDGGGEPPAA